MSRTGCLCAARKDTAQSEGAAAAPCSSLQREDGPCCWPQPCSVTLLCLLRWDAVGQ